MKKSARVLSCLVVLLNACTDNQTPTPNQTVDTVFGTLPDGRQARLYTLTNDAGMRMTVTNYGGIITSLTAADREGNMADVVLGFDNLEGYLGDSPYFGAVVGRYGNRIAGGRFTLDGVPYTLATNNGPNHLHGGLVGFDKVLWEAEPFQADGEQGLRLTYDSPHGEEGYPGNVHVQVTYRLTQDSRLVIDYVATTDRATPLNLTQHSYFNLAGSSSDTILDHELTIWAEYFTPVDETLIPTGEIRPVVGTPFDFRSSKRIGEHIDADEDQIRYGGGYDHNFVLSGSTTKRQAARVVEPLTGRVMEVHTTEPGIQFYSGNFLDGSLAGKGGRIYGYRAGFCLETQHFPDSPNHPGFPTTILRPGETYRSQTVYSFLTDAG